MNPADPEGGGTQWSDTTSHLLTLVNRILREQISEHEKKGPPHANPNDLSRSASDGNLADGGGVSVNVSGAVSAGHMVQLHRLDLSTKLGGGRVGTSVDGDDVLLISEPGCAPHSEVGEAVVSESDSESQSESESMESSVDGSVDSMLPEEEKKMAIATENETGPSATKTVDRRPPLLVSLLPLVSQCAVYCQVEDGVDQVRCLPICGLGVILFCCVSYASDA